MGPDGKQFPWGKIIETHRIGEFAIVEYVPRNHECERAFQVYVGGEDTHEGSETLSGALLLALAHKHCGRHSGAAHWMAKLIGITEGP